MCKLGLRLNKIDEYNILDKISLKLYNTKNKKLKSESYIILEWDGELKRHIDDLVGECAKNYYKEKNRKVNLENAIKRANNTFN